MKRILALVLTALLVTTSFWACAADAPSGSTETTNPVARQTDAVTEAPAETQPEIEPLDKKDLNLDGRTVNVLLWDPTLMAPEMQTGEIINDATFKRNAAVMELYNFKFEYIVRPCPYTPDGFSAWYKPLNASIQANDNSYDLAGAYAYQFITQSMKGNFHNLNENPNIDFSKPWWPSKIIETGNIGNKMFMAFGNLDPIFYDVTYGIFFTKRIAEENQINDLYGLVRDGKWTLDRMIELGEQTTRDLNGDSKIDDNDQYGYLSNWNMSTDAYIQACDIQITTYDEDGMPKLLGLTERYINAHKKLDGFLNQSGCVKYGVNGDNIHPKMFMDGQGFFLADALGNAHTLRAMDDDFGILPYPMLDEAQGRYIGHNVIGNSTGFCIPITANAEEIGAILEALAYYGWKDIRPEYIERALKGRNVRDAESEEMLDIIFDNIEFEFTQIYSCCFGDQKAPSMVMRMALKEKREIAAYWSANQKLFDMMMKRLVESIR